MATSLLVASAVIAGGAFFIDRRADLREAAAEADFPPEGAFVEVDGRRVHYVQAGDGPDVLILHGASGSTRDWTMDMVGRLADGYRVTVFDRPGHGYTERAPELNGIVPTRAESLSDQARVLRTAAQSIGIEAPLLLGQSYGGSVALAWALDAPEALSGLVLVSAPSNPWPGDLDRIYAINSSVVGAATVVPFLTAFATESQAEAVIARIFAPQAPPDNYRDRFGAPLSLRRSALRANARQVNSLRPQLVEMAPRYGGIAVPVEILHGTEDVIVPLTVHSEPLSTQIPGAVLTRLDGIGHMPHHAAPETVTAAVDRAAERAGLR